MNSDDVQPWRQVADDTLVEQLIAAIQQASASTLGNTGDPSQTTNLPAPEMATALLNLLASVLEPAPQCRTPMAMRKVSEATGKELLMLMRGIRERRRSS